MTYVGLQMERKQIQGALSPKPRASSHKLCIKTAKFEDDLFNAKVQKFNEL